MKQVIIIRKDLNMRKGKMVAQGAHASVGAFLSAGSGNIKSWMESDGMVKICVGCDSEHELWDLYREAKRKHLACYLVVDAGKTEFHGVPTPTAVAIGPDVDNEVDAITGHLKLL